MRSIQVYLAVFWITLLSYSLSAQSISGRVEGLAAKSSLGYATVDIFKGDSLMASVLTDRSGNFNAKLDTGTYRCEIKYAGYKTVTKMITIKGDETSDFGMAEDEDAKLKYSLERSSSAAFGSSDMADEYAVGSALSGRPRGDKFIISSDPSRPAPSSDTTWIGKLTAGEINDFGKWDMWTDLTDKELKDHATTWAFKPQGRYVVQVQDKSGLPLANLTAQLFGDEDQLLYEARTDNTGKAELWLQLLLRDKAPTARYIIVHHQGKKYKIKRPTKITNGINQLTIASSCSQSQQVDIAFVVDATGSMGDEIDFLKAEVTEVIYQAKNISSKFDMHFANVFYRDHGDAYLTKVQPFTRVLSEAAAFIGMQGAMGGGDGPEAVEIALDSAINHLAWNDGARTKLLFLLLDAPPHETPEILQRMITLSQQAAAKGIRIIPLMGSGGSKNNEYLMRSLALATNGTYTFLTDHSGIGGEHIEPSTDEYEVELLGALMVRIIKAFTYMPDCEQNLPLIAENYPDSTVAYQSIDSTNQAINWRYFPNPTNGKLTIVATADIQELYISDLAGKTIEIITDIQANQPKTINLSRHPSGIYLIRYLAGKKWISGKVVLRH